MRVQWPGMLLPGTYNAVMLPVTYWVIIHQLDPGSHREVTGGLVDRATGLRADGVFRIPGMTRRCCV